MATFGFHITGEFITQQARTFWADDQDPGKAVALLEAAFPEMTPATRLAIITGSKKLVGDEHGMKMVNDDATTTQNGMSLDLVDFVKQIKKERDEYRQAIRDVAQVAIPTVQGILWLHDRDVDMLERHGAVASARSLDSSRWAVSSSAASRASLAAFSIQASQGSTVMRRPRRCSSSTDVWLHRPAPHEQYTSNSISMESGTSG